MCGIFGYIHSHQIDHLPILKELKNRGPDASGEKVLKLSVQGTTSFLGMLHTRLSIIDTSNKAHQPMTDNSQRFVIVFNGEIYNYVELKSEFEKEGHIFLSNSDTEVLLTAYKKWGKNALDHLNGIFSFAIWDMEKEELFFARDQFGVKPLNYSMDGKTFLFSSELAPMLKSGLIKDPCISSEGLNSYLAFGSVSSPHTMIHNIFSLPPGHFAIWKNGTLSLSRYWGLQSPGPKNQLFSYQEALEQVRSHMQRIVSWQMRADVPVGAFLSGGIDSSLLVALASQVTAIPLNTFSIVFGKEGEHLNEGHLARKTAKNYHCHHHEILISKDDFSRGIEDFIDAIDAPSVDGLNSFFVSKSVDHKLKVVLSGLGGDELFAGYPVFKDAYRSIKGLNGQTLKSFLKLLPAKIINRLGLRFLSFDHLQMLDELISYRLLQAEYLHEENRPLFSVNGALDTTQQVSLFETSHYMLNTLLRDMDAVSMHHSLEVRVPFLDPQLAKFIFALPEKYKFHDHYNKPLIVEAFPDLLAKEIISSPKKGFHMPIGRWIKEILSDSLHQLPNAFQSLNLNPVLIEKALAKFRKNSDHYVNIWKYQVLDLWLKRHSLTKIK